MSEQPTASRPPTADDATLATTADGPAPPGGLAAAFRGARYVPQTPHAEGGLGCVYVALDREFGREVALKRLKDDVAFSPDDAARFEREGVLTGRLEHPGIVPVYGLGHDAFGQPYYAMRFVRGESLQAAAARFHAPGRVDYRSLDFRTLLSRFVAACNAIAYAHSCGVVHRDVKPANVMLGPFGETLVVDWGLAKEVRDEEKRRGGEEETETASVSSSPPLLVSSSNEAVSSSNDDRTQPGSVIGTPAYMCPEQAAGAAVGPASDVYSLGATLYVLLTGVTPFPGRDAGSILDAVKGGRVPPARQWKIDVPRALEAVAAKAMAFTPADRYASALELANDVECWLADEPVTAYREPAARRAGRWVRRHRTLVAGVAAAVLVGVVGLSVATVLLGAANARERAARAEADANLARARSAVDEMLTAVADHPRLKEGDFHDVRRELLEKAIPYYEAFARQKADDPAARADRAAALHRLGDIRLMTGDAAGALADLQAAEAAGGGPELRARVLDKQGQALRMADRRPEAEAVAKRAVEIQEQLAAADPAARGRLAECLRNLGVFVMEQKRFAEAEPILRRSVGLYDALAADGPLTVQNSLGRAMTLNNLGNALADLRREADAEPVYRRGIDELTKVVAAEPRRQTPRHLMVTIRSNLAILMQDLKRYEASEADHRAASAGYQALLADFPAVTTIRREAARQHNNYGSLLQDMKRYPEAEREFKAALAARQKLQADFPSERGFRNELARNRANLGKLYLAWKRYGDAVPHFEAALAMLAELAGDDPAASPHANDLGDAWAYLGRVARDRGDPDAALPWLTKAVEFLTDARGRNPQAPQLTRALRGALRDRADVLVRLGRAGDSLADWDRAVELADGERLTVLRLERARAWAKAGAAEKAVAEIESVPAAGDAAVTAARALAVAAAAGDTAAREAREAKAMELLTAARAPTAEQLAHADFDGLRDRDDFRAAFVAATRIAYDPKDGPGRGRHVVFLAGDEEYRSEEGLPMLAKILSQRHGFRCTVLFSLGDDGTIDPNASASLPGAEALDSADLVVMLLRFRKYPDDVMKRFDAALERGVPFVALRTSTHAFQLPAGRYARYNDFGKRVLGEQWVDHWGKHKVEATLGVAEPGAEGDPILRGVADVFGDSDVYEAYPPADAKILLRGQVLKGMKPTDPPADYKRKRSTDKKEQGINDPMMAVAWTRQYANDAGTTNRVFTTTLGAATDLQSEGLRRLIVNAVYWGLGLDVPPKADVAYVDEYQPTMYGFQSFRKGIRPADHALGKVLP